MTEVAKGMIEAARGDARRTTTAGGSPLARRPQAGTALPRGSTRRAIATRGAGAQVIRRARRIGSSRGARAGGIRTTSLHQRRLPSRPRRQRRPQLLALFTIKFRVRLRRPRRRLDLRTTSRLRRTRAIIRIRRRRRSQLLLSTRRRRPSILLPLTIMPRPLLHPPLRRLCRLRKGTIRVPHHLEGGVTRRHQLLLHRRLSIRDTINIRILLSRSIIIRLLHPRHKGCMAVMSTLAGTGRLRLLRVLDTRREGITSTRLPRLHIIIMSSNITVTRLRRRLRLRRRADLRTRFIISSTITLHHLPRSNAPRHLRLPRMRLPRRVTTLRRRRSNIKRTRLLRLRLLIPGMVRHRLLHRIRGRRRRGRTRVIRSTPASPVQPGDTRKGKAR